MWLSSWSEDKFLPLIERARVLRLSVVFACRDKVLFLWPGGCFKEVLIVCKKTHNFQRKHQPVILKECEKFVNSSKSHYGAIRNISRDNYILYHLKHTGMFGLEKQLNKTIKSSLINLKQNYTHLIRSTSTKQTSTKSNIPRTHLINSSHRTTI